MLRTCAENIAQTLHQFINSSLVKLTQCHGIYHKGIPQKRRRRGTGKRWYFYQTLPKYVDTGGYGGNCKWVKVWGLLHMDFEKVLPDSSGTNK